MGCSKMRILGIIPARYASTRFPGKPLALIGGKSMIRRVCERASLSKLDAVVVATDDDRIAAEVESFGGRYVMTSSNHRSGTDRCREALDLVGEDFDAVVNIQGDEPFISPLQINLLCDLIQSDGTSLASLAKRIDSSEELFSPNSVKVVMGSDGKALYFSRNPIPYMRNVNQEDWLNKGAFYKHIGIYAYKADALREVSQMQPSSLELCESLEQLRWIENGMSIRMGVTEAENISIDVPADVARAEEYLKTIG